MAKHQYIQFNKMPFQKLNEQIERKMAVGKEAMVLEHRVKKGFVSQKMKPTLTNSSLMF